MPGALSALGILMSDVVRDYSRTVMLRADASQARDSDRGDRRDHAEIAERAAFEAAERFKRLEIHFAELETNAQTEFRSEGLEGISMRSVDLRYAGQGYELNVPFCSEMFAQFHAAHRKRYGHANQEREIEVVNVRVRMIAHSEEIALPREDIGSADCKAAVIKHKRVIFDSALQTPIFRRDLLKPGNCFGGPAIVHEYSATTVVPPGCKAEIDEYSNLIISL